MAEVSKPSVVISYEGVDITADLRQYISDTVYKDNVHGKADEVEISFNDSEGLFSGDWYPEKMSKIEVGLVHEGATLNCGRFFIGTVNVNFFPDTVTWHCTALDPSKQLRTKKSKNYTAQTLLQIANSIAAQHDLTVDDGTRTIVTKLQPTDDEQKQLVTLAAQFLTESNEPDAATFYRAISSLILSLDKVNRSLAVKGYSDQVKELQQGISDFLTDKSAGDETPQRVLFQNRRLGASKMSELITKVKAELRMSPTETKRTLNLGIQNIRVESTVQNNETDLEFLLRISNLYGVSFNIKPPYLVFYSALQLAQATSVATISKGSISSGSITDKINETYSDVSVASHNPSENETIENGTATPNTATEQTNLLFLSKTMRFAAVMDDDARIIQVRKIVDTVIRTLNGLQEKGLSIEFSQLQEEYAVISDVHTSGACSRFADFCDLLKKKLVKKMADGLKLSRDKDTFGGTPSENVLKVKVKAENKDQADAIAKGQLFATNSRTRTGTITVPGNLLLVAGNSFELEGVGAVSQKYTILSSVHEIKSSDGYTTTIEFKSGPVKVTVTKKGKVKVS